MTDTLTVVLDLDAADRQALRTLRNDHDLRAALEDAVAVARWLDNPQAVAKAVREDSEVVEP